jgi:hypothetical protein
MTNQELIGVIKLYSLLDKCSKPYMIKYITCKVNNEELCECHFLVKTKDYNTWKKFFKNNKDFINWSSGIEDPAFSCLRVFCVYFELKH